MTNTSAASGRNGNHGGANVDRALLRAFLEAPSGVPSKTVEGMLGARGRAIRVALKAWAGRVHLSAETIDKANLDGKRGWKLNEAGMGAAKTLMNG